MTDNASPTDTTAGVSDKPQHPSTVEWKLTIPQLIEGCDRHFKAIDEIVERSKTDAEIRSRITNDTWLQKMKDASASYSAWRSLPHVAADAESIESLEYQSSAIDAKFGCNIRAEIRRLLYDLQEADCTQTIHVCLASNWRNSKVADVYPSRDGTEGLSPGIDGEKTVIDKILDDDIPRILEGLNFQYNNLVFQQRDSFLAGQGT